MPQPEPATERELPANDSYTVTVATKVTRRAYLAIAAQALREDKRPSTLMREILTAYLQTKKVYL